ncbi:GNAT family N-acetyltransferase [Geomicrobium sp. JCM 19039]|uniref:GNAT family N-acetyltransferase n=1 Tax=Geomicrobium sp. JCM 19039 TaxID=1460636 RepID=UPI00187C41E3|nr:GNAT family N-acetyltransferase [Geomicrobium sp. JCM 19039]
MEFRTLQPEEKEQAIQLGEFAFQHRFTDEDRDYLRENTQPENVWGAFDGERLASKVSLLPLNVWLHGISVQGCGVTGVSTWPEERRGGLVRELLQRGLEDMKERGASSPCSIHFLLVIIASLAGSCIAMKRSPNSKKTSSQRL